ncbi:MAG: phosphate acetyltransferase [Candidatus Raymondbacteria bacterium RifOxyA12_full_50_37]|uniref:Phosphate acetyltransferase n=1 Tax=Candidatus Raymondbacteria bacterium RIFOXYD12_FULL_49_13 TaxID=1817890 RepID=A0A1F7F2Q1_UNCRA|nr:MAG: phosphate acetyltransferase [Candidatus Raymondbacteria bacterium RifOxyA12_full_50_37]OGJ87817.1 MAG: phosphate acetyltransferase [Candidatus Raymondbacteria bacterium RifOxyB12_full_50_8]OGJ88671.1 MAG: phosphate acetyltransferase [Candidatus Raymondbacteria bacterium RIFOXYA2_FULL_49_16]OGJ95973.1 MAG: phosphate acetyltransferase [Candidatus Raymondbacteria bacterium RifOxyC12_full_50_8]OGK00843.1 MAG: phosphate acetyltransferase [Candidatus Raymondbacteria bacterium RIFOXYD12_FULL_4
MASSGLGIIDGILERARKNLKTIVLPEGEDIRMLRAARKAVDDKVAKVIIVDEKKSVPRLAEENEISTAGIELITPIEYDGLDDLAKALYERRKEKGVSKKQALERVKRPLYFGDMLVNTGIAAGCIAGAVNSTGNVVTAARYCIGAKEGVVSSCFLILIPNWKEGEAYTPFIFADCAVVPFPDASQLAAIASASADSYRNLAGGEPRVAMLSYSTKGSAKHENVDKVIKAVKIVQQRNPGLKVDGEFQLDAAVIKSIGQRKAPGSPMGGEANVLIFPDLNAGNICYKAVERFAKAIAVGPIMQGLNKPANDLSRGCSDEDIYKLMAITSVSAG